MSGVGLYIELGIQGPPPLRRIKGRPIGKSFLIGFSKYTLNCLTLTYIWPTIQLAMLND